MPLFRVSPSLRPRCAAWRRDRTNNRQKKICDKRSTMASAIAQSARAQQQCNENPNQKRIRPRLRVPFGVDTRT
ncbi:hypothetical protein [Pandoravirus japonicus]|uniref:Uncharacterized protein n=1 Tax=Pandoravirus japonicus TaxID=2823154 RepID=A0A811BLU6_9VIRU|nr:hypothetical protein [Pandoravirus japonicus]